MAERRRPEDEPQPTPPPGPENNWEGYTPRFVYRQKPPIDHGPQVHKVGDVLPKAAARPTTWSAVKTVEPLGRPPQIHNNDCVGHATAYTLEQLLLLRGDVADPHAHLSVIMPWNGSKQAEGTLGQNVGVYPHDALTYTRNAGICAFNLLPELDSQADWAALPGAAAQADAAPRKGLTFAQAGSFDELIQAAGTLDVPVMYSIAVYPAFENPTPDGRCGAGLFTGAILGYHEIVIVGYDESAPNPQDWTYICQNWWQGFTTDDQWVLTAGQAKQIFTEGWVVQLWPAAPAPPPKPVQHFVAGGPAAPFWQYVLGDPGDLQNALDVWGDWFHVRGCA